MTQVTVIALAAAGVLALLVGLWAGVTRTREGKVLAFVALFLLPAAAAVLGFAEHMDRAQTTQFCLSCHVMTDHGKSLTIDDPSFLPSAHYQNNRVPRDRACYTCHTDYTMFGGVNAKIRGLRHLWVQYAGTLPSPEAIKLYEPYNNRECLHCHLGARKFEEASPHRRSAELLPDVKSGKKSCISGGCHEFVHDVESLKEMKFWNNGQP
jgi:cytochrome c-type protein NapC